MEPAFGGTGTPSCSNMINFLLLLFVNNNNNNNSNNNNSNNKACYLKAPFKALKDIHKNNRTTKTGDNLVQMRINE